jgi:HEAT repeat protein
MLGEIKSESAVIPLMRALKSGTDEKTQIAAALSLCKIGDPRGVFAVKQEARFGDTQKVRNSCSWFYDQYVASGAFAFPAPGTPDAISAR